MVPLKQKFLKGSSLPEKGSHFIYNLTVLHLKDSNEYVV